MNIFWKCFNSLFGDNRETNERNKRIEDEYKKTLSDDVADRTPPISPFKGPLQTKEGEIPHTFTSPKGVFGNDIEKHIIRLRERGYELISMLGSGNYGKCYDVKRLSDGLKLAVKIMYLGEFDRDDKLYTDFSNEVMILSEAPHLNIISLFDHFVYDKLYTFTILEFANKGTLEQKLKSLEHSLSENQAKLYFFQISRAIDHLHKMGIAHRDIKSSNILICTLPNGKEVTKVADFGLSRVSYKSDYGTVMISRPVGTMHYMSPQVLALYLTRLNKTVSPGMGLRTDPFKADVWSLGVCLYYMLVRKYPFDDTKYKQFSNEDQKQIKAFLVKNIYKKQMKRKLSLPKHIGSQLSKECLNLLLDTLEVDKEKRIQMSGIVRNMWFDKWLDSENATEINKIDLLKFLDKYTYSSVS